MPDLLSDGNYLLTDDEEVLAGQAGMDAPIFSGTATLSSIGAIYATGMQPDPTGEAILQAVLDAYVVGEAPAPGPGASSGSAELSGIGILESWATAIQCSGTASITAIGEAPGTLREGTAVLRAVVDLETTGVRDSSAYAELTGVALLEAEGEGDVFGGTAVLSGVGTLTSWATAIALKGVSSPIAVGSSVVFVPRYTLTIDYPYFPYEPIVIDDTQYGTILVAEEST